MYNHPNFMISPQSRLSTLMGHMRHWMSPVAPKKWKKAPNEPCQQSVPDLQHGPISYQGATRGQYKDERAMK